MPTPADAPTLDPAKLLDRLWGTLIAYDVAATVELREKSYDAAMELHLQLHASLPALLEASKKHDALRAAVEEIGERSSYPIDPRDAFEEALSRAHAAARSSGETTTDQPNAVPTQVMTNE